ncbi:MAG: TolC family protein [Endomicrobium sp.]|jgi:outer membrane protein TolC|nr:TolC family protein [Endomicrobium sp.]
MKKIFIALIFFLLASPCVFAEKITAEMVELQTLQNNPSIALAKYDLDMANQALYSSFSSFLPNISFSVSLAEKDGGFSFTHTFFKTKYGDKRYSYGLNAQMSLFSGFSEYNKTRRLSTKVKASQELYIRAVSSAVCDAHTAYVALMYAYESIDLHKQIKDRRIENRDLVKLRYHSGNADLGSLRRIEADVKMTEYELETAQRAIETASAALLVAIGRNDDITILETDEKIVIDRDIISKPDFDNLIIKIPEFLGAKYNLDSARYSTWSQKGQWLPSIDFTGNINRYRHDKYWDPENQSWDATLNLRYSLFSGGQRFFETKNFVAQEKKIAEYFKYEKNLLKSKAVQYYNNWVNDYKFLDAGKFSLESCKLQADIAKRKYMNGLVSYEDWYAIEDSYISHQKSMLLHRQKAILDKIAWMKFLGKVSMKDKEVNK